MKFFPKLGKYQAEEKNLVAEGALDLAWTPTLQLAGGDSREGGSGSGETASCGLLRYLWDLR